MATTAEAQQALRALSELHPEDRNELRREATRAAFEHLSVADMVTVDSLAQSVSRRIHLLGEGSARELLYALGAVLKHGRAGCGRRAQEING